jgi:hypothetical protein
MVGTQPGDGSDRNIRSANSSDAGIAYQVVGDGPTDLVVVPAGLSNLVRRVGPVGIEPTTLGLKVPCSTN